MSLRLDHILLGVPDLDAGAEAFTKLTGVKPVVVDRIPDSARATSSSRSVRPCSSN
jgi:hypothetical protein